MERASATTVSATTGAASAARAAVADWEFEGD